MMLAGNKLNFAPALLDAVFPFYCVACRASGTLFCDQCRQQAFSPTAHQISPLKAVWSAGAYANPHLRQAVTNLKYQYVSSLRQPIAQLLIATLKHFSLTAEHVDFDMVMPIPLHAARLKQRGFNQSKLLAEDICKEFSWKLSEALNKNKATAFQADLLPEQRQHNLIDVFKVTSEVTGKDILLVDDVVTTGATLSQAAQALKQAGARRIWGITAAFG